MGELIHHYGNYDPKSWNLPLKYEQKIKDFHTFEKVPNVGDSDQDK